MLTFIPRLLASLALGALLAFILPLSDSDRGARGVARLTPERLIDSKMHGFDRYLDSD